MTSRTDAKRSARWLPCGTSNATSASASERFARTMRCAIVGSGTRNARAISFVVSPPISRRVRAIRASGDSTGWQAMKMSRRRSSSISSAPAGSIGGTSTSVRPTSSSLRAYVPLRRRRSIARCFAVDMSHAPGLVGTPVVGHASSAATSASCAISSAIPTSSTMRATPATMRGNSILNTASTERVEGDAVTAAHQSSRIRLEQGLPAQPSAISRSSAVTVQLSG